MIVEIAEIEALIVFSPIHTTFNADSMRAQVLFPLFCFCGPHSKSNMRRPRAIVRRKHTAWHHYGTQRCPLLEKQEDLLLSYMQCTKPVALLKDDREAKDLPVPFSRPVNVGDIDAVFDNSARRGRHASFDASPMPEFQLRADAI